METDIQWRDRHERRIHTIPHEYEGLKGHVVVYSTVLPAVVALADVGAHADGRRTSESANTWWSWIGGMIGWME